MSAGIGERIDDLATPPVVAVFESRARVALKRLIWGRIEKDSEVGQRIRETRDQERTHQRHCG